MIKKILIVLSTIIGIGLSLVLVGMFLINKENLDYKSEYPLINPEIIKKKSPNSVIIISSSTCPGADNFTPIMKNNINIFKKNNIDYYIVDNQFHRGDVDSKISKFQNKHDLGNELIYLMDINKYPNNSGVFNAKRRYKDFMNDICEQCDTLPLGYAHYVLLKDGKFLKSTYKVTDDDIAVYKN